MCILFVKLLKNAKSGDFKFILAANRDEYFKRPGKVAHFWEEDSNIFGGRDMTANKEGGTWLAISKTGKVGVLLNVSGEGTDTSKLGRGFLVADFLKSDMTEKQYLESISQNGEKYNKFHLVAAKIDLNPTLLHFSNGNDCKKVTTFDEGYFAIGNSSLNTPFKKVSRGKQRFQDIIEKHGKVNNKQELVQQLLNLLKWEDKHYPDGVLDTLSDVSPELTRQYSAVFVSMPEVFYGTRTHTVILVDAEGMTDFYEWTLREPICPGRMTWNSTHVQFHMDSQQ